MSSTAKWLRQAAEEIRREGHNGWGNTCEQAADDHDALRAEVERLQVALSDAEFRATATEQIRLRDNAYLIGDKDRLRAALERIIDVCGPGEPAIGIARAALAGGARFPCHMEREHYFRCKRPCGHPRCAS